MPNHHRTKITNHQEDQLKTNRSWTNLAKRKLLKTRNLLVKRKSKGKSQYMNLRLVEMNKMMMQEVVYLPKGLKVMVTFHFILIKE